MAQQRLQQQHPQCDETRRQLMNAIVEHRLASAGALQDALVQWSVTVLQSALQQQQQVSVLLSGGNTPLPFYAKLAQAALPWSRVHFALVDERWVAEDNAASNAHAIRTAFAGHPLALQNFTTMKTADARAVAGVDTCNQAYRLLPWPPALAVLGMGSDGHTASWFPGAQGLGYALHARTFCIAVDALLSEVTGPHTERMTLTLWALRQCQHLVLLISGEDKWRVYQSALAREDESLPVSLLLRQAVNLDVFWSP